jgi:hypothetical protein
VAFLGEAWRSAVEASGAVPLDAWSDGPTHIQVILTGDPAGELRLVATLAAGRPITLQLDGASPAGLVLTLSRADAQALAEGSLRLDTAYMQGRAKLAGDQGLVLRLLAFSARTGWEQARAALSASTNYASR